MNDKPVSELSVEELKKLLEARTKERAATLEGEIDKLEKDLSAKKAELAELTGATAASAPKRRGRPSGLGTKTRVKGPTTKKSTSGLKRWSAKDKIITFLQGRGKTGAHLNEIVQVSGKKKNVVSAFLATTGKKIGIVGTGKRGFYYLKT